MNEEFKKKLYFIFQCVDEKNIQRINFEWLYYELYNKEFEFDSYCQQIVNSGVFTPKIIKDLAISLKCLNNNIWDNVGSIEPTECEAMAIDLAFECEKWLSIIDYYFPEPSKTDSEPKQDKSRIPEELNTPKAKAYFNKAISLGLMNDKYEWNYGKSMLACFVRDMSKKLDMGKGDRTSWKPFEELFKIKAGSLKLNYKDIQNIGQEPSDIGLVNKVFEE